MKRVQNLKQTVKLFSQLILSLSILMMSTLSCDLLTNEKDDKDVKDSSLYVKFINAAGSEYTITSIELQPMGKADEPAEPSGTWSDNILEAGKTLAPGAHTFFDLDIPNLHWSQYRLGVSDGRGNQIMLHEQPGYQQSELPITHWGSEDRTVNVTVIYDQNLEMIVWSGWGDWAGID